MAIGSACSYPGGVAGNMKEDDFWSGPLHPSVESYGFTKKVLEVGLRAYGRGNGLIGQMPVVTNLYGEHDVFGEYRSHVAAALIKKFADAAQSPGGPRRLLGHRVPRCGSSSIPATPPRPSRDCSRAVTPSRSTSARASARRSRSWPRLVARLTGFRGEIVWDTSKADGVLRKVLDVSRMESILDWKPPTSLEAGLARTIRWYLEHKSEADARP